MTHPDSLSLEVVGDLDAAVRRSLPALADLLLDTVRRQQARRRFYAKVRDYCIAWAAARGLQLPG
jgi:hypothetical protein